MKRIIQLMGLILSFNVYCAQASREGIPQQEGEVRAVEHNILNIADVYSLCWSKDGHKIAIAYDDSHVRSQGQGEECAAASAAPKRGRKTIAYNIIEGSISDFNPLEYFCSTSILHKKFGLEETLQFADNIKMTVKKHVINISRNNKQFNILKTHNVSAISVSPDHSKIAIGLVNGELSVFDVNEKRTTLKLPGHTKEIDIIEWSPSGQLLASAAHDNTVRIWELNK